MKQTATRYTHTLMLAVVLYVLAIIVATGYNALPREEFLFILALAVIIPSIFYAMWKDIAVNAEN